MPGNVGGDRKQLRSRAGRSASRPRSAAEDMSHYAEDPGEIRVVESRGREMQPFRLTRARVAHSPPPPRRVSRKKNGSGGSEGAASIGPRAASARAAGFLAELFLPEGYPDSVSGDYLEYQMWDTLQALCSSLSGTLATHAMLEGYGVGDAGATAASATLTWVLRDGCGMAGRILFAWFQSSNLDANAKTWRLMADITNDVAMMIELVASHLPREWFLPAACAASVVRAVTGVAGGATRTAVTQHQAVSGNISDVAAKDGSQETAVNLIGMILGIFLVPYLTADPLVTWAAFLALTAGHLFANYRGVKCVVLSTWNRQRLDAALEASLGEGPQGSTFDPQRVPTPQAAARRERMLFTDYFHGPSPRIRLGAPVSASARRDPAAVHRAIAAAASKGASSGAVHLTAARDQVHAFVARQADGGAAPPKGVAQAYVHAFLLSREASRPENVDVPREILARDAAAALETVFESFWVRAIDLGWDAHRVLLNDEGSRFHLEKSEH